MRFNCVAACRSNLFLFDVKSYSTVRLYHNLFIHLPVDGIVLSSFQSLAVMTRAVTNICVTGLCVGSGSFLLGKCVKVELLSHMLSVYLIFKETANYAFKAVLLFYISTNNT